MKRFNMHILLILFKVVMFMWLSCSGLAQTSQEYFRSIGDNVILLCTIQKETSHIIWRFMFNTTASIQYSTNTQINPNLEGISDRLSIVGNFDLQISTIQKNDEGSYQCSSNINGVLIQHFAILSIVRPPTDLFIQNVEDGKVSGIEGKMFWLNCRAVDGKPPPEVMMTVSGVDVSVTDKQSVQYTNQHVTRDFDRQKVTCTANHSGLSSVLKEIATVYLNLKPIKPTFIQTSISTEETVPLTVSCTSDGSRPPASFQWYIGSTNITAFAKDTYSPIQQEETYTVNSTLTYHVNRSHNRKEVICKVTNIADLVGTEERRQLDVKYAPVIIVNSPNYTQNDDTRTVTCNPSGNPDGYIYHKWQHKTSYGDFIREFDGNKTLKLPDAPAVLRYQDSGEYICIASNGIKDHNNKFNQTGSAYVLVKAQPVFTTDTIDRVKQFGEISKAVQINVNVYSVPKFTNMIWDCEHGEGKLTIQNSVKYESSSTPTIVVDKIHGKEVQLDGYNLTLTIRDLQAEDFANYTVTLKSGFQDVSFTVILESASVPETPSNFNKIASSSTSITVQWDPNSGGGYKQKFYIHYRVLGLLEWTIVSAGEEGINEPKRRRTYEIRNLQEGKAYELKMYAENTARKRSNFTEVFIAFTDSGAKPPVAAIVGGIAGGLTAIVIVLLLIVFLQKKRKESGTPSTKLRASPGEEGEEDGLKDNILYESSQSDRLKKNILYQSADLNDDHAEATKNQKKPSTSSEYASVQKPNAIYAEVNKVAQPKNAMEKKQKDKKGKPKKTRKEKAKGFNNNPEEEYANSALQLKNLDDGEYANSTDTQGPSGHHTNPQGLEYADLTFQQISTKNEKQVIHGVDERTIYADVDHTKKAPPPPPESEYEETNIKHGKMA